MKTLHKRWGRVSAEPCEYLIKLRRGRVVQHGPGLSVFLWPGATYAVLPTSIQRISFTADQVTAEKVGVAVTGVAVYRIAEPLLAFRMLDFSPGSNGLEHLAAVLRDMFVGAARRLVASMGVEQCLTRRKEGIAQELMREIQPVVSGCGRSEDSTAQGWGILIDTIEIQDVRILSEKVFSDLQAPFRAGLELAARKAALQRDQEVHQREGEAARDALQVDLELGRQKAAADEATRLQTLARAERLKLAEIEGLARTAGAQLESDLAARERTRQLADAEHLVATRRGELEGERQRAAAAFEAETARQRAEQEARVQRLQAEARLVLEELETRQRAELALVRLEEERLQGEQRVALQRLAREVENLLPEQRTRHDLLTQALPAMARAFAETIGPVQLTYVGPEGGGGKGLAFVAEGIAQLLALARSAGVDLGPLGKGPET